MNQNINNHKDLKQLVNIQVDINRAVWAGNVTDLSKSSFKTEKERDEYVAACLDLALRTLKKLNS